MNQRVNENPSENLNRAKRSRKDRIITDTEILTDGQIDVSVTQLPAEAVGSCTVEICFLMLETKLFPNLREECGRQTGLSLGIYFLSNKRSPEEVKTY